jgi:RNA polymerase sigma-70 factor (ECF subfamily)
MVAIEESVGGRKGVRRGEPQAAGAPAATADFAEIVASYGATLYARALWLTRDEAAAADLLQDTFERAIRRGPRDLANPALLRWLMTVMTNRFRDERRAGRVRRCVRDSERALLDVAATEEEGLQLWRCVTDDTVAICVDRLPRWMKDMLRLYFAGAAYAELSAHFEIPVSTVGTRMLRIRQRLGKHLREELKSQLSKVAANWTAQW